MRFSRALWWEAYQVAMTTIDVTSDVDTGILGLMKTLGQGI